MPARILRRALLVAASTAVVAGAAGAQVPAGGAAADLAKIMERYASALKAGDVDTLVSLYTTNGVFMREDLPAVVGMPALRASYREVFSTLKVDLQFTIQETEASGDIAWLRGISTGKVKVLATAKETEESFNQLVVFRKEGATWKIRAYLYASNKPGLQTPK